LAVLRKRALAAVVRKATGFGFGFSFERPFVDGRHDKFIVSTAFMSRRFINFELLLDLRV